MSETVKKPTQSRARRTKSAPSGGISAHKAAPRKLKLLVTVVAENKVEYFLDLIQSFSVNLQFCTTGHGTASSEVLHLMGLEDGQKKVIFSLVREDMAAAALSKLQEKFDTIKNGKGIAMTLPLTGVIGVSIYQFLCDNRQLSGGVL